MGELRSPEPLETTISSAEKKQLLLNQNHLPKQVSQPMLLRLVSLNTSRRRSLLEDPEVSLPLAKSSRLPTTTDLVPLIKLSSKRPSTTSVWVLTSNKLRLHGESSIEM